jgi:hypothetical protein
MFWESMDSLAGLATYIVEIKFPSEFNDRRYSRTIFELIELVGDELAKKNIDLFVKPMLEQLADIKDIKGDIYYFSE